MRKLIQRLQAMAPEARPLAGLVVLSLIITGTYVAQGILIARVLAGVFAGGAVGSILGSSWESQCCRPCVGGCADRATGPDEPRRHLFRARRGVPRAVRRAQ